MVAGASAPGALVARQARVGVTLAPVCNDVGVADNDMNQRIRAGRTLIRPPEPEPPEPEERPDYGAGARAPAGSRDSMRMTRWIHGQYHRSRLQAQTVEVPLTKGEP